MILSSDALAAFMEVAQSGSFSKAAKALHITQSAVSQRVANLEQTLSARLFERNYHSIKLTGAGETLFHYCLTHKRMEGEVLAHIANWKSKEKLQGTLRIAAFSSVMRSVVLRAIRPLALANPHLQVDLQSVEMHELPHYLRSGKADFVVIDHEIVKSNVASVHLGYETNLLVEPINNRYPNRFLDHDTADVCTDQFRKLQTPEYPDAPRHYLDDIYGIIEAIEAGLGKGVVAAHLLQEKSSVRVVAGLKPLLVPVWLHYLKGGWETPLQKAVVESLKAHSKSLLAVPKNLPQKTSQPS